jgi:hypothetical protein
LNEKLKKLIKIKVKILKTKDLYKLGLKNSEKDIQEMYPKEHSFHWWDYFMA